MVSLITKARINEIVNRIVENYNPEKIILFGSYANQTPTLNSDLDLFIVKETDTRPIDRGVEIRYIIKDIMVPMDIIVYTPREYEKFKNQKYNILYQILKTGKIVYEHQ